MNSKTLQKLEYFKDKICSIFTHSIPREFDELRSREHFVLRISDITPDGIWGSHPYNHTRSFFFADHIQFIQEEIELDPSNPDHFQMIKDYEEKTGEKIKSDLGDVEVDTKPQMELPVIDSQDKKIELPVVDSQEALKDEPLENDGDSIFIDIRAVERIADESKKRWDKFNQEKSSL